MKFRITTQETIFYFTYGVYLLACLLDTTVLGKDDTWILVLKAVRYVCYLVAAIKMIKDDYYDRHIYWAILVLAFVALTVVCSGNKTFGFYLLMIYAAKNINLTGIIRLTCVIQGIVLGLFVFLSQIGIVQDYLFDPTTRGRHGMGFSWATTAPILFFFFMMSYIWLRKERMHTLEYVVLELLNYGLFVKTNARMSFLLSSLMLVYLFVMRFYWANKKEHIRKNRILILAPAAACVLSLGLHILYNSESDTWNRLNELLSGRLALGYDAFQEYGLSLFGTPIEWVGYSYGAVVTDYNYVDCSYMQILLENGIIMLLLVVTIYTYIMYMAIREKDFYLQTMILFLVVFSITEPRLMNLTFHPFPFFAVSFLGVGSPHWKYDRFSEKIGHIRWQSVHVGVKKRQ